MRAEPDAHLAGRQHAVVFHGPDEFVRLVVIHVRERRPSLASEPRHRDFMGEGRGHLVRCHALLDLPHALERHDLGHGRPIRRGPEGQHDLGQNLLARLVGVDNVAIEQVRMHLRRTDVFRPRPSHVEVRAALFGGQCLQRSAVGAGAGVRGPGQRRSIARVGRAERAGGEQDVHLGQRRTQLADDFADAVDVLLADAADINQVRLPRENVLRHAVLLAVVLAAAPAPHVDRGLNASLRIRRLQLGHPAGSHGVIDNAVAEGEQAQVAAFGENAARARQSRPVRRRGSELPGRHVLLNYRHLGERAAGRSENKVVLFRRLGWGVHIRRILGRQCAHLGERDRRIGRHAARPRRRVHRVAIRPERRPAQK